MNMEKEVLILNIEDVLPNRFQPRIKFKEESINELAESIKEHGVIQPIVVRKISDKYEIIAGERRYKASILAGKTTIPAVVTDLDDRNSAEVALIENVQRQNLTPIEEAISYKKILDMGYINQTDLAEKLGKTQSTIANKLRLLNLDEEVQEALLNEKISERHARSLLKLEKSKQVEMLNRIINERMTVRKTDEEINKILNNNLQIKSMNPQNNQIETNPDTVISEITQEPEIEVLNFDLEESSNQEKIEKTMEIPVSEIEKENNSMNRNEFNIPSEPIIESQSIQSIDLEKQDQQFTNSNPIENYQNNFNNNTTNINIPTQEIIEDSQPIQTEITNVDQFTNSINDTINHQPIEISSNNVNENSSEENLSNPIGGKFFNIFRENERNTIDDLEQQKMNINFEENNNSNLNPFNLNQLNEENNLQSTVQSITPPNSEDNLSTLNQNLFESQQINSSFTDESFPNTLNQYSLNDDQQFTSVNDVMTQNTPMYDQQATSNSENENNDSNPTTIFAQNNNQPQVQNIPQERFVTGNLRMVINTIRECASTIEKYGFNIDTEELDFEDMYQVTFKIEKNN